MFGRKSKNGGTKKKANRKKEAKYKLRNATHECVPLCTMGVSLGTYTNCVPLCTNSVPLGVATKLMCPVAHFMLHTYASTFSYILSMMSQIISWFLSTEGTKSLLHFLMFSEDTVTHGYKSKTVGN